MDERKKHVSMAKTLFKYKKEGMKEKKREMKGIEERKKSQ